MPDFKQTFQEEVRRLARKELKTLEEKINEQKKTISALQKRVNELEKRQVSAAAAKPAVVEKVQETPPQEGRKIRFSPKSLTKFRKKYALSQKALAILLGVTPFTVSHWEIGKNRPRTAQIEAFNALAKLGKRKLLALVSEKAPSELPAQKKVVKRKAAPGRKKAIAKAAKKAKTVKAAKATKKTQAAPVLSVAPASLQQGKTI